MLVPHGVLAVALAAGGNESSGGSDAVSETPAPAESSEAERLQEIARIRNSNQVQDLTAQMRELSEDLDAVKTTGAAEQKFAELPSGDTGTNVARGALASAVRGFAETLRTYQLALEHPPQRDNAMAAWETAAIQIDVINIAAGFGHQHPLAPGTGADAPDELPEGTGATDGE